MISSAKIEKQFKTIHTMMEQLSPAEKEILSDKLIAWLLFHTTEIKSPAKTKGIKKTTKKKSNPMSKKDQDLLKKITDKTDELYKRLGGDTI